MSSSFSLKFRFLISILQTPMTPGLTSEGDLSSLPAELINRQLASSRQVHPVFSWIWKSSCQHKHKVFFWLLIQDRLGTRNILRRKHMHLQSYLCVLCNENVEETVEHLFLHCAFASSCWNLIGLAVQQNHEPLQVLECFRLSSASRFSWKS